MPHSLPDETVVRMWLHNRGKNTARVYRSDAADMLRSTGKCIGETELLDLQRWIDGMAHLAPASRSRKIAVAKSLFRFAAETGVLATDPARPLRVPKPESISAERSLTAEQVARMIDGERDDRRRAGLRLLYLCGLRASEACGLTWRHMSPRAKGTGELTVLGKGGKKRTLAVRADLWRELAALNPGGRPDAPVLPGRDGKPLSTDALHRLVKRAARRAGLPAVVSAHWLRHACASHALDAGAPPHVVQRDLGHASLATTSRYAHPKAGESASKYLGR